MHKKANKILKYLILTSFITFLSLYISQSTGYYEYCASKKTALTNKQIKEFESDIRKGKKVDIKKYIETNNKNYQNNLSKTGLSISKTSEKCIQKVIDKSFKLLGNLVGP